MIPLVYIAGTGHSGSTLLDLILGTHSRIESVGEFKRIGRLYEAPQIKQTCTCGEPFATCPFWTRVRAITDPRVDRSAWSGAPVKNLPADAPAPGDLEIFSQAILEISGKSVLCDSSKSIRWLRWLCRSGCFSIHLVHLVRDGRAVAHSNAKRGRPYWFWIRKWDDENAKISREAEILPHIESRTLLRYEDLTAGAGQAVSPILEKLGLSWESGQMDFAHRTHHNLAGNRMRHRSGQGIEFDKDYLSALNALQWYGGYASAFAGMKQYGYPLLRP